MYHLYWNTRKCQKRDFNLLFINKIKVFPDLFPLGLVRCNCLQVFHMIFQQKSRKIHRRSSCAEFSCKSHEKTCVSICFLIKLQADGLQFIKKDSITGFFLCVLLNFEEHQQAIAFVTGKHLCWTLILIQVADPQRKWFPHKTKFLPNLKAFLYFARRPHCEAVAVLSSALLDSEAATRGVL